MTTDRPLEQDTGGKSNPTLSTLKSRDTDQCTKNCFKLSFEPRIFDLTSEPTLFHPILDGTIVFHEL